MSKGFDTTADCTEHAAAIKEAGYAFVARYSSHSAWKNMTLPEVRALSTHDIYIVNVWESAGDRRSFFTYTQGQMDGAAAYAFAQHLGQPVNSPIYFAVDCDIEAPVEYFKGVRMSFQKHGTIGKTVYRVGVYGSGDVCRELRLKGYASHAWLAQAMGWSGSKAYYDWNIKQGPAETLFGMDSDLDESSAKGGGGWIVKAAA